MSKNIVLAFLAVAMVCSLHAVEARRAGDGFCFQRIDSKTGGCKKLLTLNKKRNLQKVDCCSGGGAGWTAKNKLRASCEPCRTIDTDFSGDFSSADDEWSSDSGWGSESGSGALGYGSGGWQTFNDDDDLNGR